MFSFAPLTL